MSEPSPRLVGQFKAKGHFYSISQTYRIVHNRKRNELVLEHLTADALGEACWKNTSVQDFLEQNDVLRRGLAISPWKEAWDACSQKIDADKVDRWFKDYDVLCYELMNTQERWPELPTQYHGLIVAWQETYYARDYRVFKLTRRRGVDFVSAVHCLEDVFDDKDKIPILFAALAGLISSGISNE